MNLRILGAWVLAFALREIVKCSRPFNHEAHPPVETVVRIILSLAIRLENVQCRSVVRNKNTFLLGVLPRSWLGRDGMIDNEPDR
jgi:hypothetical protein